MRGLTTIIALGILASACDSREPAPVPEPSPTEATNEAPQEGNSIIRPEMDVERAPIPLEPLRLTIPFGDGGSELSDAALAELRGVLGSSQWEQRERIILRGHSDAGGTDSANMRVSEARAQAVADWLAEEGLEDDDVRIITFGAQNPVQPNLLQNGEPNERGRAANRRVEMTILVPEDATIPDPGPTVTPTPTGPPSTPAAVGSPNAARETGSIAQ